MNTVLSSPHRPPRAAAPQDLDPSPPRAASGARLHRWIRGVSYVVLLASLVALVRFLPVGRGIEVLSSRVEEMGTWGAVAFGVAYVLAALLFVPGAALTLAAGAIFGLATGTLVVSVASTTAAALAFLIGRHVARDAVVRRAATSPRFAAVDQAVRVGGWKIVALLRLSPAIPFSLGNYLYGLTGIRFLPYLVTSWLAMLPGTFLYVYLGYAGREGLSAAAGGGGRTPAEWALLAVGLLATLVVTVYVTRLARNAMRERTDTDTATGTAAKADPAPRLLGTLLPAALALLLASAALYASSLGPRLQYLFGPPSAILQEAYAGAQGTEHFDHAAFDGLLRRHVDGAGFVDYAGLAKESAVLDTYLDTLSKAEVAKLGRDERLALLVNAYNAFTLRLLLDHPGAKSIRDIPAADRWDAVRWDLGGTTYSLNQLEHEQIRPNFKEPRIHFALVCAAVGCPPLRNEAYTAEHLAKQLGSQATYVHTHDRWFRYEPGGDQVGLTSLYDWYGGDFEQVAGSVLDYAAGYSRDLKAKIESGTRPTVEYLDYDWALNSKENRR